MLLLLRRITALCQSSFLQSPSIGYINTQARLLSSDNIVSDSGTIPDDELFDGNIDKQEHNDLFAHPEDFTKEPKKYKYCQEALSKMKLDAYPFYIERAWWKDGRRMTFWADWRMRRDVRRRILLNEWGPDRMRFKALKTNKILPQAIIDEFSDRMFEMPKCHPKLILNMCQFTGRQRGKIKRFRVNRHIFRTLADHGQLCGVKRSMW